MPMPTLEFCSPRHGIFGPCLTTPTRYLRPVSAHPYPFGLAAELDRLVRRVRPWSSNRWEAAALGRDGSRADAVFALVELLARSAVSTPAGATPPRLRDGALADQLAVLSTEVVASLGPGHAGLEAALLAEVRATRTAIEPPPLT